MSRDLRRCAARARRSSAGLTLVELLVVMVMTAFLASAVAFAFQGELGVQTTQEARRAELDRTDALEQSLTILLEGARLAPTASAASPPAPVIGGAGTSAGTGSGSTPATPAADVTTYFQGIATRNSGPLGSDRLTFTTTAPGVPMASLYSTDDFETQQQARGPVGGLAEVSLSTTPIRNADERTGLFERIQRPSDADPTQGGTETVLDPAISSIGFEFWNGLGWVPTWDTTQGGTPRLPRAVQVSYTLNGDPEGRIHVFVVPIPASDATGDNPVVPGGS